MHLTPYPPFVLMGEKKAFALRIQAETLKELERWAQEEFRSVNGQIEFILSDALRKRKKPKPAAPVGGEASDKADEAVA